MSAAEADDELFRILEIHDPCAGENVHAFVLESGAQCRGNAGIGSRNEPGTGFEERTLTPKSAKIEATWQPVRPRR